MGKKKQNKGETQKALVGTKVYYIGLLGKKMHCYCGVSASRKMVVEFQNKLYCSESCAAETIA